MLAEVPAVGYRLEWANTLASGLNRLDTESVDAVLLDLSLPDSQGTATFSVVHAHNPQLPIVVLSGLADEDVALGAVRAGAQDYLVKGRVDGYLLVRALDYAIERNRLLRQATEEVRLRDLVLSSVSHDLRNPMAAIRLISETLRLQLDLDEHLDLDAIREGLVRIETNTHRMTSQIEELLDVAQLQTGEQVRLVTRPTDLVVVARDLVHDHQLRTNRHRLIFDEGNPSVVGRWDRPRVERVVGNLLSNAIKYSPKGGDITVRVWREDDDQHTWACISVQDSGVGIPAADLPRLFSWFFRGENVAEISGTGIGLAGSKRIVELHGGTVGVTSDAGRGSTFTVRLPATVGSPVDEDS